MENERERDCGTAGGRDDAAGEDAELAGRAAERFDRRGGEDFGNRGAEPAGSGAGGEAGGGERELAT
jgi:hypothetical protein